MSSYRPFVLISYPRSGTHLLRTALESHPAVRCQAEPFNSDDRRLPYDLETATQEILARWVFSDDLAAGTRAAGFVLQAYHPFGLAAFPGIRENPSWSNVWELLRRREGLAVIHLRRRDLLARHLSHLTSRATGKWHQWDAERVDRTSHLAPVPASEIGPRLSVPPRLEVDPARLEIDFEEQERWHARAEARLAGLPRCEIVYEELCARPAVVHARVLGFLGLEPRVLTAAVAKLETRVPNEAIANYDELVAHFAGTRWAHLLAKSPQSSKS